MNPRMIARQASRMRTAREAAELEKQLGAAFPIQNTVRQFGEGAQSLGRGIGSAAEETSRWAKEQAEQAARVLREANRNTPTGVKVAAGTAAAGATAYGAYNVASGRGPFDGPNLPGSAEAQDEAAQRQANAQIERYKQLAMQTELSAGEMAKIAKQMEFMTGQELRQAQAEDDFMLQSTDRQFALQRKNSMLMQPQLSVASLRERLGQMNTHVDNRVMAAMQGLQTLR